MSESSNPGTPIDPKPPAVIEQIAWVRRNWRKYKVEILVAIVLALLAALVPWSSLAGLLSRHKVTATVLAFDQKDFSVALRFDNPNKVPVTMEDIYFTVEPMGMAAVRPIPVAFKHLVTNVPPESPLMTIPGRAGFEVIDGQPRLTVCLTQPPIWTLQDGSSGTNLAPYPGSFRGTCDVFDDKTRLQLGIHFRLADDSDDGHDVDLTLGTYSGITGQSSWLESKGLPKTVRLLPSPVRKWTRKKEGIVTVTMKWTEVLPAEESRTGGHLWRKIVNTSTDTVVMCVGPTEVAPTSLTFTPLQTDPIGSMPPAHGANLPPAKAQARDSNQSKK